MSSGKKQGPAAWVPTSLTLLNLLSGFGAILAVIEAEYMIASLLVIAAFVFDLLDGTAARLLNVASPMGIELDSLADSVSFVTVPALMVYFKFFEASLLGGFVAGFIMICGIYRLAKFNITKGPGYFIGMSSPFFTALVLGLTAWDYTLPPGLATPIFIVLAAMMVSPVPFPNFKDAAFNRLKLSAGACALLLVLLYVTFLQGIIGMTLAVVAEHVLIWLLIIIPLLLSSVTRRRLYTVLFALGLLATSAGLFITQPGLLAVYPVLYGIILSPLLQKSIMG